LLTEEVGVLFVCATKCKKSPADPAVAMAAAKHQEAAAVRHAMLAVDDFARLFGCIESLAFISKKIAKRYEKT
jgi:hypothetical protein